MSDTPQPDSIDVKYVAHLARMHITDDEIHVFQSQLEQVLEHVNTLTALDVDEVEPTAHAVPVHNVYREDEVEGSADHETIMANAPQARNGLFIVPQILE